MVGTLCRRTFLFNYYKLVYYKLVSYNLQVYAVSYVSMRAWFWLWGCSGSERRTSRSAISFLTTALKVFVTLAYPSRLAVLFLDTKDDVSPAAIVNVIGKCADGMQNRLWIPIRLIFDARALHYPLIEQVRNIHWQ